MGSVFKSPLNSRPDQASVALPLSNGVPVLAGERQCKDIRVEEGFTARGGKGPKYDLTIPES